MWVCGWGNSRGVVSVVHFCCWLGFWDSRECAVRLEEGGRGDGAVHSGVEWFGDWVGRVVQGVGFAGVEFHVHCSRALDSMAISTPMATLHFHHSL